MPSSLYLNPDSNQGTQEKQRELLSQRIARSLIARSSVLSLPSKRVGSSDQDNDDDHHPGRTPFTPTSPNNPRSTWT